MPKVNPEILRWARETAGLDLAEAARKVDLQDARGVSGPERLAALERGDDEPSRPLLVRMAKQYRRPLLAFYMSAPPRRGNRGHDFRTVPEDQSQRDEATLDALMRDIMARQALVRAALLDEDDPAPLPFVNSARPSDGVLALVDIMRGALRVRLAGYRAAASVDAAFNLMRTAAEELGVYVLLLGNLGSHHTTLSVETFRGLAIADPIAPFIVINDQDAKTAWVFTLLHELAHLWIGESGVSGATVNPDRIVEQFCNDVASEYLLPSSELTVALEEARIAARDVSTLGEWVAAFAEQRKVSRALVSYRLFRLGAINGAVWQRLAAEYRRMWFDQRTTQRANARERSGGPSYYVVRRHRLGDGLLQTTARLLHAGALTTTKAGRVLGVKPSNVGELISGVRRPSSGERGS